MHKGSYKHADIHTGAYVGASSTDYGRLAQQMRMQLSPSAYDATAATLSVASGRLSYTFGLRGPAVTVDTVSCVCVTEVAWA